MYVGVGQITDYPAHPCVSDDDCALSELCIDGACVVSKGDIPAPTSPPSTAPSPTSPAAPVATTAGFNMTAVAVAAALIGGAAYYFGRMR